jgi:hypothetical protein
MPEIRQDVSQQLNGGRICPVNILDTDYSRGLLAEVRKNQLDGFVKAGFP